MLKDHYVKFLGLSRTLGDELANQGRDLAHRPTLMLLERINSITDEIELLEPDYTVVELVSAMGRLSANAKEDPQKTHDDYLAKARLLRVKLRRRYAASFQ